MRTCSHYHEEIAYNADECPMCALKKAFEDEAEKMQFLDRHLGEIEQKIHNYLERDPLVMSVKMKRVKK